MTSAAPVRFKAIEMTSASLGGRVRLELEPTCTVLVGRNGSGKTLVIESIMMGLYNSWHGPLSGLDLPVLPIDFACELEHGEALYRYSHNIETKDGADASEEPTARRLDWHEECRLISGGDVVLWRVEAGTVTTSLDATKMILPEGSGLLHTGLKGMPPVVVGHAEVIRDALAGISIVFAGLPRAFLQKSEVFLRRQPKNRPVPSDKRDRLLTMASSFLQLLERKPEDFRHLQDVCLRVLGEPLEAVVYRDQKGGTSGDLGEVTIGNTNIGLASDGTLRVLEMLIAMMTSSRSSLLVIEEPEMCVHPGLLGRVLNEIDSRASDAQVLLSTHSPQVLDWRSSDPKALRFLSREDGVTKVSAIDPESLARVKAYMFEDGSLADYVFQRDEAGSN